MRSFQTHLNEKVIQFNSGARYGNIVILAGGAGSGKGFAAGNFLRKENYKNLDIDEMKTGFLKISKLKKKYPELRSLKLKNPDDVLKLHLWVKDRKLKDHRIANLLASISNKNILPNILFDITAKEPSDLKEILPMLVEVGYDPKNINLVWVLANYKIALVRNKNRERVVPEDVLITTHKGAKSTMSDIIKSGGGAWVNNRYINGELHVILNNNEETWFYSDEKGKKVQDFKQGRKSRDLTKEAEELDEAGSAWTPKFGKPIVAGFTSLKIKDRGKSIDSSEKTLKKLFYWITRNAPK